MSRIENRIKKEINRDIGVTSRDIARRADWNGIKEEGKRLSAERKGGNKRLRIGVWSAVAVCCIAVITLSLVFFLPLPGKDGGSDTPPPPVAQNYSVTLSINPSVSFEVGENDVILAQRALNTDGAKLLFNVDYTGKEIGVTMSELVALADKYGYIDAASVIGVKINGAASEVKTAAVKSAIDGYLKQTHPEINVAELTEDEAEALAESCDDATINAYTEQLKQHYAESLNTAIEQKISASITLREYLYSAVFPTDKAAAEQKIADYAAVYDFDDYQTLESQDELREAIEELDEIIDELNEIKAQLANSQNIEDSGEFLEDLTELVDEIIKGKTSDDDSDDGESDADDDDDDDADDEDDDDDEE